MFSQDHITPFRPFLPPFAIGNCNHPRKTPNNPLNSPEEDLFPDNFASQWKPGHVSFVSCQAAQGLGTFCCGGLWINAAPRILHLDQIRQSHAERPQLPLSRFPDVARIQALAVLNKQSVALGIRFGLSIEPTRWPSGSSRLRKDRTWTFSSTWSEKEGGARPFCPRGHQWVISADTDHWFSLQATKFTGHWEQTWHQALQGAALQRLCAQHPAQGVAMGCPEMGDA